MNVLRIPSYTERDPFFLSLVLSITFRPEVLAGSLTLSPADSLLIYRDRANNELFITIPAELQTANGYPYNDLSKII